MYKQINNLRMTDNEASERYPDSFIIMRMDGTSSQTGDVLYVGDDQSEMIYLLMKIEDSSFCGVIEGLNHRRSLGGVVVGG